MSLIWKNTSKFQKNTLIPLQYLSRTKNIRFDNVIFRFNKNDSLEERINIIKTFYSKTINKSFPDKKLDILSYYIKRWPSYIRVTGFLFEYKDRRFIIFEDSIFNERHLPIYHKKDCYEHIQKYAYSDKVEEEVVSFFCNNKYSCLPNTNIVRNHYNVEVGARLNARDIEDVKYSLKVLRMTV